MGLNATTIWFLVGLVGVVGIFDIFQLVRKGQSATVSVTLYKLAQRFPIIALAVGVLVGHVFWGQCVCPVPM